MPRDKRLYMTLPLDFDEHPKVSQLSDAAFRAFVEMNLYSRRNSTDGVISTVTAERRWTRKVLMELVRSHPERPLVVRDGDRYVIRDYAEHQETTESIAERRRTNAANGSRGGRPRKPTETESVSESVSGPEPTGFGKSADSKPSRLATGVANEKQSLESRDLDDSYAGPESYETDARALRIKDLNRLRGLIEGVVGPSGSQFAWALVIDTTRMILDRSTDHVQFVEAYVESTCRKSPEVVQSLWADAIAESPRLAS